MDREVARNRMHAMVIASAFAVASASCSPFAPTASGTVSISADASAAGLPTLGTKAAARTVSPSFTSLYYSLTLTSASSDRSPIEATSATGAFTVSGVPTGTWTAMVEAIDSGTVYATGSGSIAVTTSGGSATVALAAVGTGSLSITLKWPDSISATASGSYSSAPSFASPSSLSPSTIDDTVNFVATYSSSLPAGTYTVRLKVAKSSGGASYASSETYLIAAGKTTTNAITLAAADFGTDATVDAIGAALVGDGSFHPIQVRWTATNAASLALERSADAGAHWVTIASSADGSLPRTAASYADYSACALPETGDAFQYRLIATGSNLSKAQLDSASVTTGLASAVAAVPASTSIPVGYALVAEPTHAVASISGFTMAATETNYVLWYGVKKWAEARASAIKYTFANPGREGDAGTDGAAPTGSLVPAANMSWRDAMVWCNALSEYKGRTPVYYADAAFTTPMRTVDNLAIDATPGHEDNPYVLWSADGYRLPTEAEWECAARYIDGATWNGGDWASGTSSDDSTVAWYGADSGGAMHAVATKAANVLGLYDMSGNASEWCFDWYDLYTTSSPNTDADTFGPASGTARVVRGGDYASTTEIEASARSSAAPNVASIATGFRVCRR